jgi:fructose-1,6-bisphosphatase II / sedoheptulose-1,7-bisphosphatase
MQGRLMMDDEETLQRAQSMGITDPRKVYTINDMVRGEVFVAATGVTDGSMLQGVKFKKNAVETETIIFRSSSGTVRRIKAIHHDFKRFGLA